MVADQYKPSNILSNIPFLILKVKRNQRKDDPDNDQKSRGVSEEKILIEVFLRL